MKPTSAHLALLSSLPKPTHDHPIKLRLVGRVISRDLENALVVIEDGTHGLLVDLGSVIGSGQTFAPGLKDLVMLTGDLCVVDEQTMQNGYKIIEGARMKVALPKLVFQVIILRQCEELDMGEWRKAVANVQSLEG